MITRKKNYDFIDLGSLISLEFMKLYICDLTPPKCVFVYLGSIY